MGMKPIAQDKDVHPGHINAELKPFYFLVTSSVILAFDKQRKKSVKYYYHTFLVLLIYSDLCMCLSALLTIVQFIMVFRSLLKFI